MKNLIKKSSINIFALLIGVLLISNKAYASEEASLGESVELTESADDAATEGSSERLITDANEAKNGIVQVNYVYIDDNDKSHIVQGATGILIGDEEKKEYVLTCAHILSMDEKTKASAYKYLGIKKEKNGEYDDANFSVQVVAENDIYIEAEVLKTSDDLDMAIIELKQPIHTRTPLSIYTSADGKVSDLPYKEADKVYSLGFPDAILFDYNEKTYSNDRVVMSTGEIGNLASVNDVQYIEHNISIELNNCGGPLVDSEGHVIGMNTLFRDGNYYCALDSTVITKVLDALGLEYDKEIPKEESVTEASTEAASFEALEEKKVEVIPTWMIVLIIVMSVVLLTIVVLAIVLMAKNKNGKNSVPKKTVEKKDKKESEIKPFNPRAVNGDIPQKQVGGGSMDTSVLQPANSSGGEGTTVLGSDGLGNKSFVYGSLIRKKNKKQELIDKPVFVIGKDQLHVNLAINDNSSISRVHASINSGDNGVFIEDCGSTNGTFVNGKRVVKGQPVKLTDGAKILLSNEEFEYRI